MLYTTLCSSHLILETSFNFFNLEIYSNKYFQYVTIAENLSLPFCKGTWHKYESNWQKPCQIDLWNAPTCTRYVHIIYMHVSEQK